MKRLLAILLLAAFTATGAQTLTNIFTGTTPNDGTGDSLPLAFKKSNTNDWFLFDMTGSTSNGAIDFTLTVQSNLQSQIDSMQSPTNGVTAEFMTNSIQAIAGQYTNDLNANLLPLIYSRAATNDADIWSSRIRGASVYNALRMETNSSFYVTPSVYFTNVGGDLYLMHTNLGRVFAVSNGIVAGNGALITNIPQAGVTGLPEALAWLTNNSGTSAAFVTTNDNRNLVFQTGRWSLTNASDVPIVAMFSTNSGYRYQSPLSDIIYRWDATGPAWRSQVNASGGSGGSLKLYSAAGVERISLNGADGGGVTLGADHPITFGETPYQIGTLAADSMVYDSWSKHVFRYGTHGAEATALTLTGANAVLAGLFSASGYTNTGFSGTAYVLTSDASKRIVESSTPLADLATDEEAAQAALTATNVYNTHVAANYATKAEQVSGTNLLAALVHTKAGTNAPTIYNPTFAGTAVNFGSGTDLEGTTWSIDGGAGYITANLFSGPHAGNGASLTDISKGGIVGLVDDLTWVTNRLAEKLTGITRAMVTNVLDGTITNSTTGNAATATWADTAATAGNATTAGSADTATSASSVKSDGVLLENGTGLDLVSYYFDTVNPFVYFNVPPWGNGLYLTNVTAKTLTNSWAHIADGFARFGVLDENQVTIQSGVVTAASIDAAASATALTSGTVPRARLGTNTPSSGQVLKAIGTTTYWADDSTAAGGTLVTDTAQTVGTATNYLTLATGLTANDVYAGVFSVVGAGGTEYWRGNISATCTYGEVGMGAFAGSGESAGNPEVYIELASGELRLQVVGVTAVTMNWASSGSGANVTKP